MLNSHHGKTVKEISETCGMSESTVKRHLKALGISTKGNAKQRKINSIQTFKKNYPSATQKECTEKIGISLRTVKRYWNPEKRRN